MGILFLFLGLKGMLIMFHVTVFDQRSRTLGDIYLTGICPYTIAEARRMLSSQLTLELEIQGQTVGMGRCR